MTHILGDQAQHVITRARECRPDTHTPAQADQLMRLVLYALDLAGGTNQAARPQAASPDKPAIANRTRSSSTQAVPMNPVHRHNATGASGRPPGDMDSGYWTHEYQRVHDHHDRCEVIRRAATYLASLIRRDPDAPPGDNDEKYLRVDVLTEGHGHPIQAVARRFRLTERTVVTIRIQDGRHPLTGKHWTPPGTNTLAATEARSMRDEGMNSTDIGLSLGRSANTIRAWTTKARLAA